MKIEMVNIEQIIPYWRNPRENAETAELLVEVIKKYGFNVPLVIDRGLVVVKGHARLKAARKLGMKQVPCIISEASDEENQADRIYDNKIAELSKWDYAKLELGLERLGDDFQFRNLFTEPERVDVTPEARDEPQEAVVGISADEVETETQIAEDKEQQSKKSVRVLCPCCGEAMNVFL